MSYGPGYSKYAAARKSMPVKKKKRVTQGFQHALMLVGDELLEKIGLPTVDDLRRERLKQEIAMNNAFLHGKEPELPDNVFALPDPRVKASREARKQDKREELARRRELEYLTNKWSEPSMTVSLYKSTASGANEIVVQTNAQSLDVFIAGLANALHDALLKDAANDTEKDNSESIIASTLKNAFPVAFAISGYKAEKVSESKLLTCGFASPDASELIAQSAV